MRVFLSNLGCKLNQAETEGLARDLVREGHRIVDSLAEADLHVVNSCTVTHRAARDSRKVARRAGRRFAGVRTVLTGCYVEGSPEEAATLEGVDLVVPNTDKDELLEAIYRRFPEHRPDGDAAIPVSYAPLDLVTTGWRQHRAALKIEDGCNMRCAFCIIPATRGRQRSRPPREILDELRDLVREGFREVVVTGVQISAYRHGETRLADLVERMLQETAIERLRLTSIAPWQLDERLLELFAGGRLCRHVHFSLQSGCSETLRRMRRPYDAPAFARLVDRVRSAVPGCAVTTDVIVGFPGETEQEFRQSLAFVEARAFARVHAFSYSERPGTAAAEMPDPVPPAVRRARVHQMIEVARRGREAYVDRQLGLRLAVVWEKHDGCAVEGTSDNYVQVRAESAAGLRGPTAPRLGEIGEVRIRRREGSVALA